MIGKLLGHARIETTARYAHLARDSVDAAAAKVAASIGADILGNVYKKQGRQRVMMPRSPELSRSITTRPRQ